MKPTLTYFDIRGRAEPIRLLLEEAGVEYVDRQIPGAEWQALKPKTPFGGLPSFHDPSLPEGRREFYQAPAILRHLARVHGLDGADEPERVYCDVAAEAVRDAKDHMGSAFWQAGFAERREAFVADELPVRFGFLEHLLDSNPTRSGFLAGPDLSYADLIGLSYLDDVEGLFPGALAKHDALLSFRERVATRPRIAAYRASDRRTDGIMYGPEGRIREG